MRRRWRALAPIDKMGVVVTAGTAGIMIGLLAMLQLNGPESVPERDPEIKPAALTVERP